MRSDLALFSKAPLTVSVGGRQITVPWRPAAEWIHAVGRLRLLAAMLADDEGRETLADLVMEDPRALGELHAESLRILAEQTGRKWWEAGRLINTSAEPEVLGRLVLAGVDPWTRSIGEWCAAVYALAVKNADEKGRLRFDFSLSVPPVGHEDEWDDEGDDAEATLSNLQRLGMVG